MKVLMASVLVWLVVLLPSEIASGAVAFGPVGFGGGGGAPGSWTLEILLEDDGNACDVFNAAIAPYMDATLQAAGSNDQASIRVHHDGLESITVATATDYVDHGPYKSCFVMHQTSNSTVYPDPFGSSAANVTTPNGVRILVYFDNLNILYNEASLDDNAALFDIGNGWGSGGAGGMPKGYTLGGRIVTTRTGAAANALGLDPRSIPSPGRADGGLEKGRFDRDNVDAHVVFALDDVTYVDLSGLDIMFSNMDENDIGCHFTRVWGSRLPTCQTFGSNNGHIGIQFLGAINATMAGGRLRNLHYGIVIGSPKERGESQYYTSCAEAGPPTSSLCANDGNGVIGITYTGGVIEGNKFAQLVDFGSSGSNIFRDIHWESGTNSISAAYILKPFICDGTSGGEGVWAAPNSVPVVVDDDIDCLVHWSFTDVADDGPTATLTTTAGFPTLVDDSDSIFIDGTGIAALDGLSHEVDEQTSTTITVKTDPIDTASGLANAWFAHDDTVGGSARMPNSPSGDGVLVFAGRMLASGVTGGNLDSPAFMIGEDFTHVNTVMFTDGASLGKNNSTKELFTIHANLLRAGAATDQGTNNAANVGRIDTSGARFASSASLFPGHYDNWSDSRLQELFYFQLREPAGGDNTDWSVGGLPTDHCIHWDGHWPLADQDGGSSCSSSVSRIHSYAHEVYIAKISMVVAAYFTNAESCEIGITDDRSGYVAEGDYPILIQIPPVADTTTWATNESYNYAVQGLMAPGKFITTEVGDGNIAPDGTSTPNCWGASLGANIRVYGFPFDPFD